MKVFLRLRWLAALWLGLASLPAAHASHIIGGDIQYASVASTTAGVPRYRVTVRLFRDIAGVDQPSVQLTCNRGGCNATAADFFTLMVPRSRTQPRPLFTCSPGPGIISSLYDVYFYDVDVDLPRGQWTLSFAAENRNANIVNFTNSASSSFYVGTYLDNTLAGTDASPQFLSNLLPYLNSPGPQRYTFSAFDSDGDSLVYQFTTPQQGLRPNPTTAVLCGNFVANWVPTQFQLSPATGALSAPGGATLQQGYYAMAAYVYEFRRLNGGWQLIGRISRDIAYLAYATANTPPQFTGYSRAGGPLLPSSQVVSVPAGQSVSLLLSATDPDAGQALRFSSDATAIIPGLSLTAVGATQARLTWQVPASLPPGRYTATVAVFDDSCPANASEEQTFSFRVTAAQPLAAHPAAEAPATAFPMPFREQVQFGAAAGQAVVVVDALGRVVAQLRAAADGQVLWQPAASLPAGLYLARSADGHPLARLLHAAN